ncbi:hypothetical protein J437_LFUL011031 [Ladona fulva]|uniref:Phosphatidylserine decarboxylase proenzyme, mitochondrial n=1 Tax=Ladona fulva TaxID=123851 RepID=A0A8K0KDE7_LADFU|nr:hypothetical protein J437_LFUL011031 [Ladona fulva]
MPPMPMVSQVFVRGIYPCRTFRRGILIANYSPTRCCSSTNSSEFGRSWQRLRNSSVGRYVRSLEWTPLPLGIGFALLAVLQWRHIRKRAHEIHPGHVEDWEITCYRMLPLRVLSRAWGWALDCPLPVWARTPILSAYASTFGCNLSEASQSDLCSYRSLAEFFTRSLKDGCRPIDAVQSLVSPADGKVLNFGRVDTCQVEQVKGVTYSLETFLGPPVWKKVNPSSVGVNKDGSKLEEKAEESKMPKSLLCKKDNFLYQCVIYLAPGDYHRFHSPVDWKVTFRRHFQGELLSVNPRIAKWIPNLFSLNERAVYVGTWEHGFFSFTAVGATNVGSIKIYCDKTLHTNEWKWKLNRSEDKFLEPSNGEGYFIKKGDPFGEFNLGSTVVLLFEAPPDFNFSIMPGQVVKVGEPLHCSCRSSEKSS